MAMAPEEICRNLFKVRTLIRHAADEAGGIHSPEPARDATQFLLEMAERECDELMQELDLPVVVRPMTAVVP